MDVSKILSLLSSRGAVSHSADTRAHSDAHPTFVPPSAASSSSPCHEQNRHTANMITRLGTQVGTTEEMRLRSGHRVGVSGPAAKIPTTAAEARALLMKDVTKMPDLHAPAFREGLQGLMNRWTALQLAILNEWGGSESVSKGVAMYEELEHWFLKRKAGKYAEDLEELLIEILGDDFCVLCEDGSPREVANVACLMYEQVANGNYEMAADVCAKPLPKEHLELSKREEEDRRWTMGAERGAGGAGARMNDDSSDNDDDDEAMDAETLAANLNGFTMKHDPEIDDMTTNGRRGAPEPDDDGWCVVPNRGGR